MEFVVPEKLKHASKAVVAALLVIVGVLVALGVIDTDTGEGLTTQIVGIAAVLGIVVGGATYGTKNIPKRR